jgi:drug/metabolite transporter (DMT)-like permease
MGYTVVVLEEKDTKKNERTITVGVLYAFLSALLSSVCSVLVRCSGTPAGQISCLGFLVVLVASFPLALYRGEPLFPKGSRARLLGHSFSSSPIVLASYQAVRLMPLADEAVLAYSSIVFTVLLARVYLKEPCGPRDFLVIGGILLGVVLLTGPFAAGSNYPFYGVGAAISLFGSLSDSVSYILVRKLTQLHYSVVLLNYAAASFLVSLVFCGFESWVHPLQIGPLALAVVFLSAFQELFVTRALLLEQAALVALVHTSDVVFAYIWELSFFHETYSPVRLLGASLVASMVIYTAISKH